MNRPTVLTSQGEALEVMDGWRDLAARCEELSYFAAPDWVIAWWETLGAGLDVELAVWRDGSGALEAVVGLARVQERLHHRVPWTMTVWNNLGSGAGAADHCGWAVLANRAEDVRRWLAEKASKGPLLFNNMDPVTGVPFVPDSAGRVAVSGCPRLAIPEGSQEIGGSPKFRKKLRAYEGRLARSGVRFRWVSPEAMTDALLDVAFDLHGRRQQAKGRASSFGSARGALHRRLIARAGPGRGPAAVLAQADDGPIGVLYGFLWGDVFAYYQSGWDPAWATTSLGTVLVAEAIRFAGSVGARVFDFLRGAEEYKYRFGAVDREDETWLVPTGPSGWLFDLKHRTKARRRGRRGAGPAWEATIPGA